MRQNKALVRRLFDEVYNQRALAVAHGIQDAAYAALEKPWVQLWVAAFPDLHMRVEELIGVEETVVAVITMRGTHLGTLEGELINWLTGPLAVTRRSVEIQGIFVYRVVEGKLAYTGRYGVADWLGLLRQLGTVASA